MKNFLENYLLVIATLLLFFSGSAIIMYTDFDLMGAIICVIGIMFSLIVSAFHWLINKLK